MNKEKFKSELEEQEAEESTSADAASRARNQTVMLTPEMTGQVRALLNRGEGRPDPLSDILPPVSWDEEQSATKPAGKEREISDRNATTVYQTEELLSEPEAAPQPQVTVSSHHLSAEAVQPQPQVQAAPGVQPPFRSLARTSPLVGFLVSYDKEENGEVYEVCAGRWLITSKHTDHGEYLLIDDPTISPLHAILRATRDGTVQILDQLSEFGTSIKPVGADEEEDVAGTMMTVQHGARIRFGERRFVLCLIPLED